MRCLQWGRNSSFSRNGKISGLPYFRKRGGAAGSAEREKLIIRHRQGGRELARKSHAELRGYGWRILKKEKKRERGETGSAKSAARVGFSACREETLGRDRPTRKKRETNFLRRRGRFEEKSFPRQQSTERETRPLWKKAKGYFLYSAFLGNKPEPKIGKSGLPRVPTALPFLVRGGTAGRFGSIPCWDDLE